MTVLDGATVTEGTVDWQGRRTWYRVVGPPGRRPDRTPLVICHGGPGLTHDYLAPVAESIGASRTCVLYDQIGNGRSEHHGGARAGFWTPELFVEEIQALLDHLGMAGGYHLLGHSWGGMLALELAVRRPAGLRSLVVADAFASSRTYREEVGRLLSELPQDIREPIERHEAAGTTGSPEYQAAVRVFYGRHVCRARPVPPGLLRTLAYMEANPAVYETMMGPSEFSMTGTLRDWDIRDRLDRVEVPLLLVSGRHDEVTPRAVEEIRHGVPGAEWHLFEESSHMPHLEEPVRFREVVETFLARQSSGTA
ncbi:proline iminopeptidase-family hydrolase [Streptomyces sp. CB03234]|uniref:proline iminopeptidase-family hydrolase n=1 Tax=Streptomyces sp. (strain CB03234) TaxID=1703937 RepID=UPI001F521420|nr:proline iminopeptidase-family hydrolase [Streptomyces sp. CB03234]